MISRLLNKIRREHFPLKNIAKKNGILFLTYHSVDNSRQEYPWNTLPDALVKQVDLLKQNFEIISLDQAYKSILDNVFDTGQVVITFDDGYASIYDFVFPLFKQLRIPFALFASTTLVSSGYRSYCNWRQVCEMSSHELVTIGSHGVNHLNLGSIELSDSKRELIESKEEIEIRIGRTVKYMAYPYGVCNTSIQDVCSEIYKMAFINSNEIFRGDLYRTPRVSISAEHNEMDCFINLISRSMFIDTCEGKHRR